jgi:hypothetical protein
MNAKPTDHDDPRLTRSSGWVVFFLLGALLGVHAIYLMVLPSVEPDHWREFTTDPKMLAYLADDFRSAWRDAARFRSDVHGGGWPLVSTG